MKLTKISLFDKFGSNVLTRNKMQEFFIEIEAERNDRIVLDFKNVEFVSRSCADEYLKLKNNTYKKIEEINMVKNVSKMLDQVKSTRDSFFRIKAMGSNNSKLCYN